MKVSKVRPGEKFVLDDRGGVWEHIGVDVEKGAVKARCFFGSREAFRTEIEIDPEDYCYVIFEGRAKPFGLDQEVHPAEEAPRDVEVHKDVVPVPAAVPRDVPSTMSQIVQGMTGMRIRIVDDDSEELIQEIATPTMEQVVALSAVEAIRLTPSGHHRYRIYRVADFNYDMDENVFYLAVRPERIGGADEDAGDHRDQSGKSA